MTFRAFQIQGQTVQKTDPTSPTRGNVREGIADDHLDVAHVTTQYLMCVYNETHAEKGTTRPATQVGVRPVKAGLGGHDDGVSGDDDGVGNTSLPL